MTHPLGTLPSVKVGDTFRTRTELHEAGVHRHTMMGISWAKGCPAESIVLSGAYEDDNDWGDTVLYTGMGKTENGMPVEDQKLASGNLALLRSMELRSPVRVIRSAKAITPFSPLSGLRYDGLYRVTDAFFDHGRSGKRVWRFVLVNMESLMPLPEVSPPQRSLVELYGGMCQVCKRVAHVGSGPWAIASPIVPLSRPHCGPDDWPNLLSLCPTHAVEVNAGRLAILPDLRLAENGQVLFTHKKHSVEASYLSYRLSRYAQGVRPDLGARESH